VRRRLAIVVFLLLVPIAAHATWDYIESRRLFTTIDALRQRGEPVSRDMLGRWKTPATLEEYRAARYYEAAAALAHRDVRTERDARPAPGTARGAIEQASALRSLPPAAAADFARITTEFREALDMMDRGAELPFSRFVPTGNETIFRIWNLEVLSEVASIRTVLLAHSEPDDAAARSLWSALRLRRAHERVVPWISDLVIDVQLVLENTSPSSKLLADIQAACEANEHEDMVERDLRERRASLIESMLTELYGRGANPLIPAAHATWLWRPGMPTRPWIARGMTESLQMQQEVLDAASHPWPQKLREFETLAKRSPDPTKGNAKAGRPDMRWYARNLPWMVDAKGAAITLARARSARMAIAVARFRHDHGGEAPTLIEDLVPAYIAALPRDPFSDGALRYRRSSDSFVVYSVGADGNDDGGQVEPQRLLGRQIVTKDIGVKVQTQKTEGAR
jgi:hypothetical protein